MNTPSLGDIGEERKHVEIIPLPDEVPVEQPNTVPAEPVPA